MLMHGTISLDESLLAHATILSRNNQHKTQTLLIYFGSIKINSSKNFSITSIDPSITSIVMVTHTIVLKKLEVH